MSNNFLIIFFIIIQSFKNILSLDAFNNAFNHIYIINSSLFYIYLGSEIAYIIMDSNNYIDENVEIINDFNNSKNIIFNFTNENKIYQINETIKISYLENRTILFYFNEKDYFTLHFEKNEENQTNIRFYLSNIDNFFINYYFFSFVLIICGCFITLYGGYHFMFGFVIHLTYFAYFFVMEFLGILLEKEISMFIVCLYLFFCFILSLSMSVFLNTDKKDNKRYMIIKIIYGCSFGFNIFRIISYYNRFFSLVIINKERQINLYFGLLAAFIFIGAIVNLFNPFKKYIFVPCSIISGSIYIMMGLSYVLGGYHSHICAIKEQLDFYFIWEDKKRKGTKEYILTYLFIHILLIIFSIFYQIKYIQYKQTEIEELSSISRDSNAISRVTDLSNISESFHKDEREELIDKNQNETKDKDLSNDNNNEKDNDNNDDDEINDQED